MSNRRDAGFSLVEMVIAIVIIGIGLAGLLSAFDINVRASADPVVRKQMLAVAEEMLEEILLKPFDANGVAPVNATVACGAAGAVRTAFDDVRDYAGYATTGICDVAGAAIAGLGGYNLSVVLDDAASLSDGVTAVNSGNTIRITVSVVHAGETLSLVGWRTNYGS